MAVNKYFAVYIRLDGSFGYASADDCNVLENDVVEVAVSYFIYCPSSVHFPNLWLDLCKSKALLREELNGQ